MILYSVPWDIIQGADKINIYGDPLKEGKAFAEYLFENMPNNFYTGMVVKILQLQASKEEEKIRE